MNINACATALAATLVAASPVWGHHSDAGVDMQSVVAFAGTVRELAWRNPHVYFVVETERSGKPVKWELQMGPVSVLARRGWTPKTLSPGDKVTVRVHPALGGRAYGILESVEKAGGLALTATAKAPAVTPLAKTLAGKWLTDRQSVLDFPAGSFDDFFRASLSLTEKGKAAQAAYNALSAENPESTCIGRPTPAALISSGLYLMEIDLRPQEKVAVFRSEAFSEVRTIYMDGRQHPAPSQRFATGHSIGRWEGETLVVDTTNFADHRSPYQIGVPSGGQKHVVERYRLTKDGTHVDLEFTLEDPEYLAKPMTHRRQLIHSPHLDMFLAECDPKATSRFLASKR
jgi:hypothetical protein